MTITLITGANKGLGLETARQLVEAGHTVYLGARDLGRGKAAAEQIGARFVQLDVTDQASVDAAAETIRADHGRLDVLVNNAGIAGTFVPTAMIDAAEMLRVYDTADGLCRAVPCRVPDGSRRGNRCAARLLRSRARSG
jgi:NAD(P)-dependent dehydrogenase (short-subunit alcohol dehydrogenase family)